MNKYLDKLVKGNTPVELTDSSLECLEALEIINTDCVYNGFDFGSNIFWDQSKTIAVIVWKAIKMNRTLKNGIITINGKQYKPCLDYDFSILENETVEVKPAIWTLNIFVIMTTEEQRKLLGSNASQILLKEII